jgi:hypothetical protein
MARARNLTSGRFVLSRVRNDPPSSTREAGGPGARYNGAADARGTAGAPQTPQTAAKGPEGCAEAGLPTRALSRAHNGPGEKARRPTGTEIR